MCVGGGGGGEAAIWIAWEEGHVGHGVWGGGGPSQDLQLSACVREGGGAAWACCLHMSEGGGHRASMPHA